MPISAPMPNSPPSANWVEALCIRMAESSSFTQSGNSNTNTIEKETGVILQVTPSINPDGQVISSPFTTDASPRPNSTVIEFCDRYPEPPDTSRTCSGA